MSDSLISFNPSRRRLLAGAASALAIPSLAMPSLASASTVNLASFSNKSSPTMSSQNARQVAVPGNGPSIQNWPTRGETRQIWLKRPQSGEEVVARYFHDGQIDMGEYLKVCRIMRDVRGGVSAYIDVEVLDLVFSMQKWLVSWGIDKPIIIQSGYRSPATNANTEGSAKNSLHMQGRALDIRMPGVSTDYLGRLASIFEVGGVGFYVSKSFVHTDTGKIRYWNS